MQRWWSATNRQGDTSQQAQQPEPDKPRTAYLTKYEPGFWALKLSRYNC